MKIAKKETLVGENGLVEGVAFAWANDERTEVRLSELSEAMLLAAAAHGLSQKLGDSYASMKGDVRASMVAWTNVRDSILQGDWNQKAQGTGGQAMADLIRALAEASGKEEDEAREVIQGMEEAEVKGLKKHAKIKALIAGYVKARADKAAEDAPDLGDLFEG